MKTNYFAEDEEEDDENESSPTWPKFVGGILVIVLLFYLYPKFIKPDTWQGFYYPNEGDLTYDIKGPEVKSLEECRDWVNEQVYKFNPDGTGYDYECGKNCKEKEGSTLLVCKETLR